jgi:hypothetical protein
MFYALFIILIIIILPVWGLRHGLALDADKTRLKDSQQVLRKKEGTL